jgi:glycosyltransferase involved in cell wall biosynthesis
VYPSRLEGIGLCVPEALACGLPVITTDDAPMNEFVSNGVNGLLVRVAEQSVRHDGYYWPESVVDIDDLKRAMQAYVDDRQLLLAHKRRARESAVSHLDWMKNAAALGDYLAWLAKQSDRRARKPLRSEKLLWSCEAQYASLLTFTLTAAKVMRDWVVLRRSGTPVG